MAVRIGKADFDSKIGNKELVLVEFYSDSCIACKKLAPTLGNIEDNLGISVYKVNTEYEELLVEQYEILARPTLILFRDGEEVDRKTGVTGEKELEEWIKENS